MYRRIKPIRRRPSVIHSAYAGDEREGVRRLRTTGRRTIRRAEPWWSTDGDVAGASGGQRHLLRQGG